MANMASACALVLSNDKTLSPLRTWRTRAAASTCVLVTVSVVCICVLVVCGVFVVREYSLAVAYVTASCVVHNVTYASPAACQHCPGHRDKSKDKGSGGACVQSSFPCVQVMVTYSVNWKTHVAILHHDSIDAAGIHNQCSYHTQCHKDPEENRKLVEAFALQWQHPSKQRDHFRCFYNTANFHDVIIYKRYTKYDVMHSMLWPSLVLVTCCVVFLYMETRRRKLTFCGRRNADSAAESSADRRFTPDASDSSQVFIRRNLIHNGGLDDGEGGGGGGGGRIAYHVTSSTIPGKQWKSYSSLEKLVVRRGEELPRHPGTAAEGVRLQDAKSRSFDRLVDETRRVNDRLKVDPRNDGGLRRGSEVARFNPQSLQGIGQQQTKRQDQSPRQPPSKADEAMT